MRKLRVLILLVVVPVALTSNPSYASMFGEETAVLLEVVSNQLAELGKLAESIGIAKDQKDLLMQINEGVQKSTSQIRSLESIIERAQGVDPTSIRGLADINRTLGDMNYLSSEIQELLVVKMFLCDQAIEEAGLQSDTAYKMGQELTKLGTELSSESKLASPGRAQQITASASTAQTLAMGVELQTLAQIAQLMAMSLDLQKSQMERDLKLESTRKSYLKHMLTGKKMEFPPSRGRAGLSNRKGRL